uniref:Glycine rich extracellular protein 1 n=1 Tax=Peromyscus maniculatus bairdii TaxID=230844 RepID=A0A8C8UQW4_PERMB
MGIWVFPIALSLLCLTPGSLQGGLPRLPPNVGKGYSPSSGLGAAFGGAKPQKPGSPAPNGYGTGVGGGMESPKSGSGGVVKPQKSGYGPGLGAGVFPGVGAQPAPALQNGHGPGIRGGMKPPMSGFGAGAFPGVGAQPGLGAVTKTQKPGFGNGNGLGAQPGFGGVGKPQKPGLGNGNGLEAGAFPGTGAQPGLGEGMRPQKPDYGGVKAQKPGFRNGNGLGLGAQPGPSAQNGHGPGIRGGMKPPKPGFGNGHGIGAAAQPGFGGGRKPHKPGYGNGNGLDALPDYGTDMKSQKPGFRNGHGLGVQLGYRNGLGARVFQGQGTQPGYMPENRLGMGIPPGYSNGNGMAAQPGPCNGGIAPPQLLPRSPTPAVPSDKGSAWGLKSQLLPPVQNAPTPAMQWGPKPQKAGYQPSNGYGAEAEPGFHGLKLQKVGFHYGNGALETGIFPETLQSGFPIANGFRNGLREETLLYPKATVPTLERNGKIIIIIITTTTTMIIIIQQGQAGALRPWGPGMKPGYGYAGLGNQAGPYGQLRPELGLEHFGDPEVKADTKSQLGNGYRGHCPSGKC